MSKTQCSQSHSKRMFESVAIAIRELPESQKNENGRHACPMCAYEMGLQAGLQRASNKMHELVDQQEARIEELEWETEAEK